MNEELKIKISVDSDSATRNIKDTKEEVQDFEKQTQKAADEADKAFDAIGSASKTAMKAVAGSIAAGAAALVGLAESTREYRTAQGKLITAFESAGSSAETATEVYGELNSVLGDGDVAVEAASHLAKLTKNEKDLKQWTDICTGVFATFGDSLPVEGLTEAVNHTAKLGEVQGALADALEWSGENVDEFNELLAKCNSESEREKLIRETLNGLYSNAASGYRETNAEIIEANKAAENWNAQLASMGGYVEPLITSMKNFGTSILQGLEEPMKDAVDFITEELIPGVQTAGKWIDENKGIILAAGAAIVAGMITYKASVLATKLAEEGLTIATMAQAAAQKILNAVMNANPLGLVLTAVVALTAGMVALSASMNEAAKDTGVLTEAEKELVNSIDEETEAINNRKTAYEETAGTIEAQMSHTTALADELGRLVDEQGRVKEADEARVKFILNELNEALGTEYQLVDGVIQNYKQLESSIYDVIAAKTANALLEAKNEAYIDAINNEDGALQKLIATEKDYEAQVAITAEADKKAKEARARLAEKAANVKSEADGRALASEAQYVTQLEANALLEQGILDEKKAKYDEAAENYSYYYDTIGEYEEAAVLIQEGKYKEATEILKNKSGAYFEYASDVDAATQQALDALYKEAIDTGIQAKKIKQNFEDGVEGYTEEMVKEAEQAHEDAMKEWEDAYNEAHGIGGDMGDGLKDGLESKKLGLLQKARNLISSIWNAMRKEADSHSPSKKTMALGGDLGEGLEIGLDKSQEPTAKAAKNLIEKSIMPIEASISKVSFNNLDKAFSSTILPSGIGFTNETLVKVLPKEERSQDSGETGPIYLQIDGKTFAQLTVSSINNLTRQTGMLPLVMM